MNHTQCKSQKESARWCEHCRGNIDIGVEVRGLIPGPSNGHSDANGLTPLRRFFGAVLPRR